MLKHMLSITAIASVAFAAASCGTSKNSKMTTTPANASATSSETVEEPQDDELVEVYDWKRSNIHIVVQDAFILAGHEPQEAMDLAVEAVRTLHERYSDPDSDPPTVFLPRKSNLYLVLEESFRIVGYPEDEAHDYALAAYDAVHSNTLPDE